MNITKEISRPLIGGFRGKVEFFSIQMGDFNAQISAYFFNISTISHMLYLTSVHLQKIEFLSI